MKRAAQRFFSRVLGKWAIGISSSAAAAQRPGPDDDDAYTLFDGIGRGLHSLSVESLENLHMDPGLLPGAFRIRVARSRDSQAQAGSLVRRRYASRGYQVPSVKVDPHLFTFVAYNSGDLAGTVGLRFDSDRGLSADQLYKAEIDALRRNEFDLCEFTRLAIDAHTDSKPVLAGLFHTAYLFAHRLRAYRSAVIEVNPRHVIFYQRALGFEVIGPERLSPRVKAPAVLLCVHFKNIADSLRKYAGNPELGKTTRSLFPYGFSAKDEEGILERLRIFNEPDRAPRTP